MLSHTTKEVLKGVLFTGLLFFAAIIGMGAGIKVAAILFFK